MVTVQFFKYPDRLHWRHEMRRLGEDEHGVWLGAAAGAVVQRGTEPPVDLDRPFVQLITPSSFWSLIYNGEHYKYPVYVDIATPAEWINDHRVEMIDIDLDVVRLLDGSVAVLDEDEFLAHRGLLGYPDWLVDRARTTAAELVLKLETREEPFGEAAQRWLQQV
jgi:protein associated with RNAse G/E